MFIAHISAGYLLTRSCLKVFQVPNRSVARLFAVGLLASVLPDFDLLYFYLIDAQQHNHHSYWTHIPIFWIWCYLLLIPWTLIFKLQKVFVVSTVVFINVMGHMVLDTVAGGIRWGEPFSDGYTVLLTIQPRYDWWVLNFVLHWSFLIEVALIVLAIRSWLQSKSSAMKNNILFTE